MRPFSRLFKTEASSSPLVEKRVRLDFGQMEHLAKELGRFTKDLTFVEKLMMRQAIIRAPDEASEKVIVLRIKWRNALRKDYISFGIKEFEHGEYDTPPKLAEYVRSFAIDCKLRNAEIGCIREIFQQDAERFGRGNAIWLYRWDTTKDLIFVAMRLLTIAPILWMIKAIGRHIAP